jgi:hypothetical protein
MLPKHLLKLTRPLTDQVASVFGKISQLVRGDDNRPRAIGHGHLGHRQRCFPIGRTIVDAGQQMAMNVDKTVVHGIGPTPQRKRR